MFKKIILISLLSFSSILLANNVTKKQCDNKGDNFIFAGKECIEYRYFEGEDNNTITIIIHGTWDLGTNTLGRYAPFAESMNMMTELTTIAVALPGYSNSSTNTLLPLATKKRKNIAASKEYVNFLATLIETLKTKFKAKNVYVIGHSVGAMMLGTLTGIKPKLIKKAVLVGGRYDIHEINEDKSLISMIDVLNKIPKDTKYLFIYGSEDKISKPEITTKFFKIVKQKKLDAKLVEVKGAGHIDLDMTDTATNAITEFFEEE